MGSSGSTPDVTREETRSVFSPLDEPGPPLTIAEVAEKLECPNQTAQHNLETLAERGELQTKQIDGQSQIWWRSGDESDSAGQQSRQTAFNRFVNAVEDYAIFMLDPHGTIVSWNEGAEQIKGYAETEILGEHLSTFYTDADIENGVPDANLETAAAEGRIEDEGWRVRKDGSRFWADVVITAIHDDDGTLQGFTKVTRDMTEQQEYEQLQEEQVRLLERIATGAPLEECLSALCSSVSRLTPGTRASILLADEEREAFHRSIAPDLQPSWGEGLEGAPITDLMIGTCGEAVCNGTPITCENVETDDRWADDWRELCVANGVMAGHSEPIQDEDGTPLGSFMLCFDEPRTPNEWEHQLADFGTHIASIAIERDRSRRALRDSEERQRLALDVGEMGVWELDLQTNDVPVHSPRHDEIFGYEECEDWSFETFLDHVHPADRDQVQARFEDALQTGDLRVETRIIRADDEHRWITARGKFYDDDEGEPDHAIGTVQDITDRKRANNALEQLNDTSRELMDADPQTISDRAAAIARNVLDIAYTSLWHYDEDTGELQRHTRSTASGIDPASIQYPEEFEARAWQTFVSTEMDVSNEFPPVPDSPPSAQPLRSGVIVPLGRHGVICAGSLSAGAFDEMTVDLAETVAATIETALDRAANEQEVARHNEELTRLNQINSIIRDIDQALVAAETREEIDRVVCEQLAQSDRYHCAWIGEYDLATETLTPQEWAGIDASYFEALTITTDDTELGQGPIGTAARTHEVQVIEDIVTDARFAPWREQTLEYGVRSCIAIPLVYNEALYGVLTVYTSNPQTEPDDHTVLGELGETIAHTINAIETKETLHTDSVVELELRFQDPDTPLCRLAQHAACRINFEGFIPQANGLAQVFFTAQGVSPAAMQTAGETAIAIEELTCLAERDDASLFKATVADPSLPSVLVEQDAMIRTLTIEGETATAVVDLPSTVAVREFIEDIQTHYPATDLRRRQTRDRPVDTPRAFRTAVDDRLTDRQQETLRTAYLSGFFESPRETNGQEIAEAMDVSQPTFVQHLRAGERKLVALLFDGIA